MHSNIHVYINGRNVPNEDIIKWETKRANIVLKKLGSKPLSKNIMSLRHQLHELKVGLGQKKIKEILKRELMLSDPLAKLTAWVSFGQRRYSITEIFVENAKAEQFVQWFEECNTENKEAAMLAGTPDHYVISTIDGVQEVIETNGGAPFAAKFYIDYEDLSSLRSEIDPSYPLQIAGVARSADGLAVGGVRHQFRNEGNGFRAKLTVEYPLFILPQILSGHQMHLASEFSNWISAAFGWDFL